MSRELQPHASAWRLLDEILCPRCSKHTAALPITYANVRTLRGQGRVRCDACKREILKPQREESTR
jgi:hypothetical protein